MDLSSLKPSAGSRKPKLRVGRGMSSGSGKTCGRGHKGQKARSGSKTPFGFEGGQMPLKRRLPKRGFTNIFKKRYALISVADLQRFETGATVDPDAVLKSGLAKNIHDGVKVLGTGDIDRPLTVKLHKMSRSARDKIIAAGGTVEEL